LLGFMALGVGFWSLERSLRCESWPTVEGVIESAGMQSQTSDEGGITYSADIAYAYQVAGRHYDGHRLAFGGLAASAARARAILDRFPPGRKVPVFYAPGDPQLAVLEPGIHGGTWVCFGVGLVFVLAGVMMRQLFSGMRRPDESDAAGAEGVAVPGRGRRKQPPSLLGVIIMLMGSFVLFGEPAASLPNWICLAAGGMFVSAGLYVLTRRQPNPQSANLLLGAAGLAFLCILHWVSFGPGARLGTVTTPVSVHGGNVKTPFALFTVFLDLLVLFAVVCWWKQRRND
jgi:hypothetical protein